MGRVSETVCDSCDKQEFFWDSTSDEQICEAGWHYIEEVGWICEDCFKDIEIENKEER